MFKLFKPGICPIGIDVGSHAVRMVQFQPGKDGLRLQSAARVELESLDDGASSTTRLAAALRHALSNQEFRGRHATLSLPAASVHSKSVRLPQMPDSDLSQALIWEAKDRFGFEFGDNAGQLVWFRAGEVRRGTEVKDEILLFAVEGTVLNDYIQCLSEVGLRVGAIDLSPCAIYRSLRRKALDPAQPNGSLTALLDLGHHGSQFFILRDGELVFYKYVDIGGKAINQAVAEKLGITPTEAQQMRVRMDLESAEEAAPLAQALADAIRAPLEELGRELDMCMRYYVVTFRGNRPEAITVAGRQASSPQVRQILASALGLNVEEAQPLRGVHDLGDTARPDRSGEWALAAGLSLYPINGVPRMEAAA